jgi:FtsX extracellular domain
MMSMLVSGSRFPVGSSAKSNGGWLTNARAIETRCCSPPDSRLIVDVYMKTNATAADAARVRRELLAVPHVRSVQFESKAQAYAQQSRQNPAAYALLGGTNPLPDTSFPALVAAMLAASALVSAVGSGLSLRRFLRV